MCEDSSAEWREEFRLGGQFTGNIQPRNKAPQSVAFNKNVDFSIVFPAEMTDTWKQTEKSGVLEYLVRTLKALDSCQHSPNGAKH